MRKTAGDAHVNFSVKQSAIKLQKYLDHTKLLQSFFLFFVWCWPSTISANQRHHLTYTVRQKRVDSDPSCTKKLSCALPACITFIGPAERNFLHRASGSLLILVSQVTTGHKIQSKVEVCENGEMVDKHCRLRWSLHS